MTHADTFRALHVPGDPFILANAWDAGSAKMLKSLGARAIGTSSAGHAFTLGLPDGGTVPRDAALAHATDLMAATDLPVSGDFEDGFGAAPETCAETVRLSVEAGLAGLSIEDTALPGTAPHPFDLAVERIRAAADAAAGRIVLCARADGVMTGAYDLAEAIRRLQAFEAAGADCLYVPMPPDPQDIATICAAVSAPVNVLVAGPFARLRRAEYAAMGAARLSLGAALARVTHRAVLDAAGPLLAEGDFSGLLAAAPGDAIDRMLG